MIDTLNEIKTTLGMDGNYFYPLFVSITITLISLVGKIIMNIYINKKIDLLNLKHIPEGNFLMASAILYIEILYTPICFSLKSYIVGRIEFKAQYLNLVFEIIFLIIYIVIALIILKKTFFKKKFLSKREKRLLFSPIYIFGIFYIVMIETKQENKATTLVMLAISCTYIIIFSIYFTKAKRYDYSHLKITMDTGDIIDCNNISKVKRKKILL